MNTRNIFVWLLTGLVVVITILALLGIWDVLDWGFLKQYMGKTIQSLIIIVISGVVIYIINALFGAPQKSVQQPEQQQRSPID
jgi:uncharacterized membrane protein